MNVDSNMEEKNATMHHLGLGAAQHKNKEDEERIESNEPRVEFKPIHKPITQPTPKKEEHVQVKDVIGEPVSYEELEEDRC